MISDGPETNESTAAEIAVPPVWCRNCQHPIHHNYCPNCGQHARDHNTKLWNFIAEFLEEFIRFDSKFLRTVVPLVSKPGFLTQEWVQGKRARYITPLKIYIMLSAIAFLVISLKINSHTVPSGLDMNVGSGNDLSELMPKRGDNEIVYFFKQSILAFSKVDKKVLLDQFMGRLPTACFLMVPIAAVLFGLLYVRRSKYYVEHLVFTLHYSAFSFLMLATAIVVPWNGIGPICYLWVAIYLFLAMKRSYGQGWIKTFFKFSIFGFSYSILIALVVAATAMTSAFLSRDLVAPTATPTQKKASEQVDVKTPKLGTDKKSSLQ